ARCCFDNQGAHLTDAMHLLDALSDSQTCVRADRHSALTALACPRCRAVAARLAASCGTSSHRGLTMHWEVGMRKNALRALALALPILALAVAPGQASAASQTLTPSFAGSGSNTEILSALAVCDECAPDAFFEDPTEFIKTWGLGGEATIKAQASWSDP